MEMSKRLRAVIALVLVVCVLLPATAFPLQYAPNAPRKDLTEGHPDPPDKAAEVRSTSETARYPILLILAQSLLTGSSNWWFGVNYVWVWG